MAKIDHIAIPVAQIEASIKWYQGSFGAEVIYQDAKQAVLQFENIKLQLVLPSYLPGHIAFKKDDAETYGELRQKEGGEPSCFIADASGNPVEIIKS